MAPPYIWQHPAWPGFSWDEGALVSPLAELAGARGRLAAEVEGIGLEGRARLEVEVFVEDAVGTAAIEGDPLPPASVRSSVVRRLGLEDGGLAPPHRHAEGLVEVLVDATRNCAEPLTAERLLSWHAALFPTGRSGMRQITVGAWRPTSVQVRSGPAGSEVVHFEGPPPERVPAEIAALLAWWEASSGLEGVLRAGVAHLWLETIHPFEDGNGRVGRALADLALARAEGGGRRLYSLSQQIVGERTAYYAALQAAQGGDMDVTPWLLWFSGCVGRAVARAREQVRVALERARLLDIAHREGLHPRQVKAVQRMLEAGPEGFEGGMTNRKYRALTRASRATAARDLIDLEARGFLVRSEGGGRSTHYELNWELLVNAGR